MALIILDGIEDNNRKNQTRLRETLSKRNNIRTLSWTEIIEALRQPAVGKNTLADKLQRKYIPPASDQFLDFNKIYETLFEAGAASPGP